MWRSWWTRITTFRTVWSTSAARNVADFPAAAWRSSISEGGARGPATGVQVRGRADRRGDDESRLPRRRTTTRSCRVSTSWCFGREPAEASVPLNIRVAGASVRLKHSWLPALAGRLWLPQSLWILSRSLPAEAGSHARIESEPWCVVTMQTQRASVSRRSSPAGASPVSVSAGAPSSRPQAAGESPVARAGCQEPLRREPARGPQHQVKPAASSDLQPESRAGHVAAKAMSAAPQSGDHARRSRRGMGRSTRARRRTEHERPVCAAQVGAERLV